MTMRPRAHYKKPKQTKKTVMATLKIVLTFGAIAVFGMVFYYAISQGWEAVFAWFGGRYFCLTVMFVLFALTAGMWLWTAVASMRRAKEDE